MGHMAAGNIKFSVIITAKNSALTLVRCLESVFANILLPEEVIFIDCGSSDASYDIAGQYSLRAVSLAKSFGKGAGRNHGARLATTDVLVFIDADVVVPPDAFSRVSEKLNENPDLAAVNGLLSKECPAPDFYSQYKNLYMNYRFKQMPDNIDFLFTSFSAIRSESFIPFSDDLKAKDTEAGQKMSKHQGKSIYFDRELEVLHLKRYTLRSILHNTFIVAYGWARIFWKLQGLEDLLKKRRFAHSSMDQILSVIASFLVFACLLLALVGVPYISFISLICFLLFLVLNYHFFSFLYREKGTRFFLSSIAFTFIDNFVAALAIGTGFTWYFIYGRRQR
jgi:glycosyltransferase involved in cell wall biosynthesis